MRSVMGTLGTITTFAVALCVFTEADAIENASRVAISARLDLSREVRPAPRPPIIVNAVPPVPLPKNVTSSQAQEAGRPACPGKPAECGERHKIAQPRSPS